MDVGTHRAFQDIGSGIVLVVQAQVGPDADDDVGTHLACQVGGEIVLGATVNQNHGVHPHGSEDARHSHTRPDGPGQRAAFEDHFAVGYQVGGNAAKGARQRLEIDVLGLAQVVLQGLLDVDAADEASRQRVLALVQEQAVVKQVDVLLLAFGKRLVSHRQAVTQDVAPVHAVDNVLDVLGIISHGIHAADDAAH